MLDLGATQWTLCAGITTSLTLGTLLPSPRWGGGDTGSGVTLGHLFRMLRPWETAHQQVGWGPGPSWKSQAASFHGARRHGNETSAAGLQQSQERQAPFLSISQEPNWRGWREVGTIRLSEPGWGWRQGEGEAVFLFNGPAINYQNMAPYFTPPCLCSHYSLPENALPPPCLPGARPTVISASFYLLTFPG